MNHRANVDWKDLRPRLFYGLPLAIIVLFLTWHSVSSFILMCSFVAFLMLFEWLRMMKINKKSMMILFYIALLFLMLSLFFNFSMLFFLCCLMSLTVICFIEKMFCYKHFFAMIGFLYISFSIASLVFIRAFAADGLVSIFFLLSVVWVTDSFAYCAGKFFGGPRIAVSISPAKTYTGAMGGILGGLLVAFLFFLFNMQEQNIIDCLYKGLVISFVAEIGDFLESWLKRLHQIKDSGKIIPGHGGIWDRVDGLSLAGIVFYFIL